MQYGLPVIVIMLACVLFVGGLASKRSRSNLIWYVLGAGCLVFVVMGCTSCALWFHTISVDLLGFMGSLR